MLVALLDRGIVGPESGADHSNRPAPDALESPRYKRLITRTTTAIAMMMGTTSAT